MHGNSPVDARAGGAEGFLPDVCVPGSGWAWTPGADRPAAARAAEALLHSAGIPGVVTARGYGETDSCGVYRERGIDFTVELPGKKPSLTRAQQSLLEKAVAALKKLPAGFHGKLLLRFATGESLTVHAETLPDFAAQRAPANASPSRVSFQKKVYVVIYNPVVDVGTGERLISHLDWNDPRVITGKVIDFFSSASGGRVQYAVVETDELDGFPRKIDGYTFTVQEYLDLYYGGQNPHASVWADYNAIVNDPDLDICGKANRYEIDEVWIYTGPYFGFYESTLVGPESYWFNSPPVPGPWTCERMIPIMGPSPQRWVSESVENFGHRMESTMRWVYGGDWRTDETRNGWEKFALVDYVSPRHDYSGCGTIHYPPNGERDYDWANRTNNVQTNCEDFHNYPNLTYPPTSDQLIMVNCSAWGCDNIDYSPLDYFHWWFGSLPAEFVCGPDDVAADWWSYFAEPAHATHPFAACPRKIFFPNAYRR
jgi:hypothetical protein